VAAFVSLALSFDSIFARISPQRVSEFLGLSKIELARFRKIFDLMDRDQSGEISLDEFWSFLGEKKQTMLHQRIFQLLEASGDGKMDFGEFLHASTTFAMFGRAEISKLVFSVFDPDANGKITMEEFEQLIKVLHSDNKYTFNTGQMFKEIDTDDDGILTYKEFSALVEKFPKFMHPANELQTRMQNKVMGHPWWDRRFRLFQEARENLRNGRDPFQDIEKAKEVKRLKNEKSKEAREKRAKILENIKGEILRRNNTKSKKHKKEDLKGAKKKGNTKN
jgi:Ca2+-binding EF-hand superfamily protein